MVELFQISKGREFQMIGAATEKLRDPKPVRARGRIINWSQTSVKILNSRQMNAQMQSAIDKKPPYNAVRLS